VNRSRHLARLVRSVADPRTYAHALRLLNYYGYAHVAERRRMHLGSDVRISPNASFRNGERITVGPRSHIGERCMLWAGESTGTISLGEDCLLGPEVMVTAANYAFGPGVTTLSAPRREAAVVIGRNVWLGARVVVTAGVQIGDDCVVGAGAVVTHDIPAGTVAAGIPARPIRPVDPTVRPSNHEVLT